MKKFTQRGIGLIEVVIGTTIITVGILSLIVAYTTYVTFALANEKNVQAAYLAEEALGVMTFLRDETWSRNYGLFNPGTTYYLSWTGSAWATTTVPQYVDGSFLRAITIENVYRDGTDKIAATGSLDTNTKKVTVTLSYYQGRATTTKTMTTYVTNLYDN